VPAHNILFKNVDDIELQPPIHAGGASRICITNTFGLQLRRLKDDESGYWPVGKYKESWAVLPNWKAEGIVSLFGFGTEVQTSGSDRSDKFGGSVGYQLSNDDGATWLWHNGTTWVFAGSNDWNTEHEVDMYIRNFPLTNEKQVRIKVRLSPSADGDATPSLKRVTIYADLAFDFQDDLLRSMKHWLERYCWIRAQYFVQIPQPVSGAAGSCPPSGPSDVIMLEDKKWEELSEPASVYNLTTDPNRSTNLFAGFVAGGIQMTSPQEGYIEANFMARPPIYIAAEEFVQLASIPSVVVQLGSVKERRDLRIGNLIDDISKANMDAKTHLSRVWFDAQFRISCQSDLKAEATRLSDAVNEALSYHRFVRSLATGETMPVPVDTPLNPAHRVAQGLFVREYTCTLFGKTWLRRDATVDRTLAREIRFLFHPVGGLEYVETVEA